MSSVDSSEHSILASSNQNLVVPGKISIRENVMSKLLYDKDIDFMTSKQHKFQVILDSSILQTIKAESNLQDKV